jgi:hypothetical protein
MLQRGSALIHARLTGCASCGAEQGARAGAARARGVAAGAALGAAMPHPPPGGGAHPQARLRVYEGHGGAGRLGRITLCREKVGLQGGAGGAGRRAAERRGRGGDAAGARRGRSGAPPPPALGGGRLQTREPL